MGILFKAWEERQRHLFILNLLLDLMPKYQSEQKLSLLINNEKHVLLRILITTKLFPFT